MYLTPSHAIACKIALYGPPGAGRNTCMRALHAHLRKMGGDLSPLTSVQLNGEEALAFIWNGEENHHLPGHRFTLTVISLSGPSRFREARRSLVEACDGVIFVADARPQQLDENIDAMNDLMEHLRFHQLPEQLPMVMLYNHSDDRTALPMRQLDPLLNHFSAPSLGTVASLGRGIDAAWLTLLSIIVPEAESALPGLAQGPTPSLDAPPSKSCLLSCHACGAMLEVDNATIGSIFTCGSCGATIQVIDPETGHTGPMHISPGSGSHASSAGHTSSSALMPKDSHGYGLQSLPSAPTDALNPSAATTGPISAAPPFEIEGFSLLKELDSSPLGDRFRLFETAKQRKLRVLRVSGEVMALPGYRMQIEPYIRMVAKVAHPNILPILGLRWQAHNAYILSEDAAAYESLSLILARRRRLSPSQALDFIEQIALALEEAARHGVVHGFLRPDVILVAADGRVRIDDLGLPKAHAHLIQETALAGQEKEFYLAPEHLLVDAPSDIRTDCFLLGALLYRMLSAEGLVTGTNAIEALHRFNATGQGHIAQMGSSLPRDLLALLQRMTAIERRDRFQHYGEFIESIERAQNSLQRQTQPLGRKQTGSAPIRGGTRKNTAGTRTQTGTAQRPQRVTGTLSKTAPIRTTRPTVATMRSPHHRAASDIGSTTGVRRTTRGTQNLGAEQTGQVRRAKARKKSSFSAPGLIIIALLLAFVAGAVFLLLRSSLTTTPALPGENLAQRSQDTSQTTRSAPRSPRQAINAYANDPSNENLYDQARAAVQELSGPERTRLEARLRSIREQHAAPPGLAQQDPRPSQAANQGSQQTTEVTPVLSAQQRIHFHALRREQRYREAQDFIEGLLGPSALREQLLEEIADDYRASRQRVILEIAEANSLNAVERILLPVQEHWNMSPEDSAWAQRLLREAQERFASAQPDTVVAATPPTDQPVGSQPLLPLAQSPGGFLRSSLDVEGRMRPALINGQTERVQESLAELADDPEMHALSEFRNQLWGKRSAVIQEIVEQERTRLRVNNPVGGGLWDVTASDDQGIMIRNPAGGSLRRPWSSLDHNELVALFQQVGRVSNPNPEHLAVASVVNLTLGQRAQAQLLARQAEEAAYPNSDSLQQLMMVQRDQELLAIIDQGMQAQAEADPFRLAGVIQRLQASPVADHASIHQVIAYFDEQRQGFLRGKPAPGGEHLRDLLNFHDASDRLSFPQRQGSWMIREQRYVASGSGTNRLHRNDLGNAQSLAIDYLLLNTQGHFTIAFRGIVVQAQASEESLLLRNPEGHERRVSMNLSTNTIYTLAMTYDPQNAQMQVYLNHLDPITIALPQASADLEISSTDQSQIALDRVTISRFGQTRADPRALQEPLISMGLIPYGDSGKDPDSPAITIPSANNRSGLGIPLGADRRGIRLSVSGNAPLRVRLVPREQGMEGDFVVLPVAAIGSPPSTITVTIEENQWILHAQVGDNQEPLLLENSLQEGADTLIIEAENTLIVHRSPEIIFQTEGTP